MSRFERGVSHYTVALVPIRFPKSEVSCRYCPMRALQLVNAEAVIVCRSTGEIIQDIDNPGESCPAIIQEEEP